jgi:tetratricopeptide (TPR) repeat protein
MKNRYNFYLSNIVIIVISLTTRSIEPHDLLALAYQSLMHGNYENAITYYQQLNKQTQLTNDSLCNLAFAFKKCGFFSEAEAIYDLILQTDPACARAHRALSHVLLAQGKFTRGWHEYEWRWIPVPDFAYHIKRHLEHYGSLDTIRLVLKTEYGFGDVFQFIRYAQVLKNLNAYIILESHPKLIPLLSLCPYIDEIYATGSPLPPFHYEAFIMSGPLICNTQVDSIPQCIPYLFADQKLIKYWGQKINTQSYKIGLCWQADMRSQDTVVLRDAQEKSIPVDYILSLARLPGIQWYSLQKHIDHSTIEKLKAVGIHVFEELDEEHGCFMDTAALMQHLDLVISIDTSVAHLAGALAKPVWILLPKRADWRWLTQRTDSPWYPTMRLFRQIDHNNWDDCINRIKEELVKICP